MTILTILFACCVLLTQTSEITAKKQYVSALKVKSIRGGRTSQMSLTPTTTNIIELKTPPSMFLNAAEVGTMKGNLSPLKTFILGIMSGCHIALGSLVMIGVGGASLPTTDPALKKLITGIFGPPLGLIMTIIGGGELFLGNCGLIGAAYLNKSITKKQVLKNLFVSYLGNLVGGLLIAYLAFNSKIVDGAAAVSAAIMKTSLSFKVAFLRGILCNWFVCMGVYMASGSSSLPGKALSIFMCVSALAALGLEHSVANMFLIPFGILNGAKVPIMDYFLKNLLPVTMGNLVGGIGGVSVGYAMGYGSMLNKSPTAVPSKSPTNAPTSSPISSKAFDIRGGFTNKKHMKSASRTSNKSALSSTTEKRTGSSFLPPEALERAKVGNNVEKIKQKKDPTSVWTDVYEYAAAIRSGTLNWEEISTDDIDFRVKYAGMFHRKKATPGKFMIRLRIPNGIINSNHMRYFSSVVAKYGPDIGVIDITTRMNIQLRSPPVEDCADIITGLQQRGLTCLMSGLDNLRNMVGSPIAGIDPLELYDTRRLNKEIDSWYSNNGKGNPEWSNMPRKFNIAISGSRDDFSHTLINDIGLQACPHPETKQIGFNIVLGGYISIKRAAEAIPMNVWIPEEDALNLCKAILRLFRDYGARGDRQKARLMWLIEEKGLDTFKNMVAEDMAQYKNIDKYEFQPAYKHTDKWTLGHRDVVGIHPQKQEGLSWVGVHVPVGRISAEEALEIADLADKYSNKEIRLTVDQNIIFPNVPNAMIADLLKEPIFTKPGSRLGVSPGHILGHLVSCTGSQFCPLAMVETKLPIVRITQKLEQLVEVPMPVRIHMTGCPNSCGQAQVADIGLMGAPARKADATGAMKAVPGVNIYVGGHIGEEGHLQQKPFIEAIPYNEEDLVPVLTKILIEQFGGKLK